MSNQKVKDVSYKIASQSDDSFEMEPPEGGWGYMVCLSYAFIFLIITGPMGSFGIIYEDFFRDIGLGTSGVTFIMSFFNVAISFTGFFTSNVLKYFTLRQVGMIGAVLYIFGSIGVIFSQNVGELIFSTSILQGMGFGILMPVCLTSFNTYFCKKRAALMSGASVIVGIGTICYPLTLTWLMEVYGFRQTLIFLCCVNMHLIPAIAILQPVEWHAIPKQKPEVQDGDSEMDLIIDRKVNFENLNNDRSVVRPLILRSVSLVNSSISNLPTRKNSFATRLRAFSIVNTDDFYKISKSSSLRSIGNWTSNVMVNEAIPQKLTDRGKLQVFCDLFDVSLLKDPIYVNICMGAALAVFVDLTFFGLEPLLLSSYNFDKNQVALCVTASSLSDLISRVIFAILNFFVKIRSRHITFVGIICTFLLQLLFMEFSTFRCLLIISGFLGFFRSWIHVFLPLVFAEYCPQEKFSAAYGLSMIATGFITAFLGPFIGGIRDYTNSYQIAMHCLSTCLFVVALCWSIEFIVKKYKKRARAKSADNLDIESVL